MLARAAHRLKDYLRSTTVSTFVPRRACRQRSPRRGLPARETIWRVDCSANAGHCKAGSKLGARTHVVKARQRFERWTWFTVGVTITKSRSSASTPQRWVLVAKPLDALR